MLNRMCGASKNRDATAYPVFATATALAVCPASAEHHGKRPRGLGARDGRQVFQHKAFRACIASCGWSSANQYTVRKASIQVRADGGVLRAASSMISFARGASPIAHSMLWRA